MGARHRTNGTPSSERPSAWRGLGAAPLAVAALAAAVLAALPTAAAAQETGRVQGVVRDAETGEPLSAVQVRVEGLERRTASDEGGRFVLAGLPAGVRSVVVERIGLRTERREVRVPAGGSVALEVSMQTAPVAVPGIVVSALRELQSIAEVPASAAALDAETIREAGAGHPSEVLGRVAGVHVNVTGGEGHMTAIRQPITTDPIYLFLEDGIPTRSTGFFNHNALYEVNVPQAEAIEVIKGPGTALYGSDAIGGVVNVRTRPASTKPDADARLEGGPDGWWRVLGSVSDSWGAHGLRADLNLTGSDGWRDGTAYDRQSATVRWDAALGGGGSLKTVAAFSRIDQRTAGSSALFPEDFARRPELNYTPISFRDVRAFRLSTEWETRAGETALTLTPYLRRNEMDMLPNWSLTYDPAIWETENGSVGLLAMARRELPSLRGRLIAGLDLEWSPGSRFERTIEPVRDGDVFTDFAVGAPLYDYDVSFRQASPYVQVSFQPLERLRIEPGLRVDVLGYDYETRLSPTQEGSHRRPEDTSVHWVHPSPKLGLVLAASSRWNLFASYRHGFRVPSEGQLFRQGPAQRTVDLSPVRADSWEAGLRGRPLDGVNVELAGYWMPKSDDLVAFTHPDGNRETQNAGRTLHRGVELSVGADLPASLGVDAAWSYAVHTYEEWRPRPDLDFGGNEMESAPRWTGNVELAYAPAFLGGGRVAAEWERLGAYWADAANTAEYDGHDLLNLRASVPIAGRAGVFARLMNVTDERFAERATFNEFRGLELAPGRPRSLFVGLRWE